MSIPSRCRAVVFDGTGTPLRVVDLPVSWPKAGEAIVQVELTTLDPQDFLQGDAPAPLVLGHETVGTILALGDPPPREFSGGELAVGDRVIWSRYVSCGDCFYCRRRLPQECESLKEYGGTELGDPPRLSGGMAELVHLWPKTAIFRVPKALPASVAASFPHAGAIIVAAFDAMIAPVNTALVLGGSQPATFAAMMLEKRGIRVLVCSKSNHETTLSLARSTTENHSVDSVIDLSGGDALSLAIGAVRNGGSICLVNSPALTPTGAVSSDQIIHKHIRITGIHRYKPEHLASALEFTTTHAVTIAEARNLHPTTAKSFSAVNEALADAAKSRPIRIAFEPDWD
jgi:D-arabinose 1-dehydrogenase-like Zn-dependent alcohol dehydrogenase